MAHPVILGLMIFNAILFGFVLTPILLYYSYKYYQYRDHVAMKKRYCGINMFEIASTLSKLILAVITTLLLIFGIGFEHYIFNIFESLQQCSVLCLGYVQIWRFWILRYEIIFTNIAINDEWKSIINPFYVNSRSGSEHNKSLSWYFGNKRRFGNAKWVGLRIILPITLITSAIQTYILMTDSIHHATYSKIQTDQLLSLCVNMLPLIIFVILYVKTPLIDDNFFIRAEMQRLFLFKCASIAVFFMFLVYHYIYTHIFGYNEDLLPFQILELLHFDVIICCQFGVGLVSTYWVNKKLQPIMMKHLYVLSSKTSISRWSSIPGSDIEMHEMGGSNLRKSSLFSASSEHNIYPLFQIKAPKTPPQNAITPLKKISMTDKTSSSSNTEIGLMHILSHHKGSELFIHHLLFEFSVECALSLVEMIQFQQFIYKWFVTQNTHKEVINGYQESLFRKIQFASNVPLSFWIYGQNACDIKGVKFEEIEYEKMCEDTKIIAYHLAQRYVFEGAEYEINIPYTLRTQIVKQMATYEIWIRNEKFQLHELLGLYEECVNSMYSLMRGSYERFKRSNSYYKLQSLWMI